jgi:hypothetical protein
MSGMRFSTDPDNPITISKAPMITSSASKDVLISECSVPSRTGDIGQSTALARRRTQRAAANGLPPCITGSLASGTLASTTPTSGTVTSCGAASRVHTSFGARGQRISRGIRGFRASRSPGIRIAFQFLSLPFHRQGRALAAGGMSRDRGPASMLGCRFRTSVSAQWSRPGVAFIAGVALRLSRERYASCAGEAARAAIALNL